MRTPSLAHPQWQSISMLGTDEGSNQFNSLLVRHQCIAVVLADGAGSHQALRQIVRAARRLDGRQPVSSDDLGARRDGERSREEGPGFQVGEWSGTRRANRVSQPLPQ